MYSSNSCKSSTFILVVLLLFSCDRYHGNSDTKIDFMPCENDIGEGFIGANGEYCTSREIEVEATPVINGMCVIDETLYKVGSAIADTIPLMRNLVSYGIMNDGLIPVCKENGYITLVNPEGKEMFQLKDFDDKEVLGCYAYSDSKLRVVLEDGTFIYVDKSGQKMFDLSFSWATDFVKGHAIVQTTSQNENLYSLIDNTSRSIFTFESESKNDIVVSHDIELLSSKENEKIIIYDFKGKRILECPAKVCRIYSFCRDGFIFYNDDDLFGLMSYKGDTMIRAKYELLVPHGQNFLALTDDDEIRLVDVKDNILKEFDGTEIIDYHRCGYDFPNVIEDKSDNNLIIDLDGNVVAEDFEMDLYYDDIESLNVVQSDYFPSDEVLALVLDLCGNEEGVSNKYGVFFDSSDYHCLPKNINFLSSISIKDLENSYRARMNISRGVNYALNYDVVFDEPIVQTGATALSTSAWLQRVEMYLWMRSLSSCLGFMNKCVLALQDKGCAVYYRKGTDYILQTTDNKQIIVVVHNWHNQKYEFCILMMQNTDHNRTEWKSYIESLK